MKSNGYIAITASIVLSLLLMVTAISLGSANLFTRLNVTDFHTKQFSYALARSCLNHALLELANSPSYTGNETVVVSGESCTLLIIVTQGQNKIIKAEAQISGATTNLQLTVDADTLSTVSLEELQSF